jgi:hypothetical protein
MEEDCIGTQGPQQTVQLEEEKKKIKNMKWRKKRENCKKGVQILAL